MNDYGLRNRFAIITETPGQPTFERRIYAQYAYFMALLEYTAAHAEEMQAVVKKADDDTVAAVMNGAEAGTLTNFLDGEYRSRGKIDLLAYRTNEAAYKPGTSLMSTKAGTASGPPEVVPNVDDLTKPVGTRTATVPALLPAAAEPGGHRRQAARAQHPRDHARQARCACKAKSSRSAHVRQSPLRLRHDRRSMERSRRVITKEFPAGSFYVDMAQPMANAAFYYLEPQARDGFVGWGVMDDVLRHSGRGRAAGRLSGVQGAQDIAIGK